MLQAIINSSHSSVTLVARIVQEGLANTNVSMRRVWRP